MPRIVGNSHITVQILVRIPVSASPLLGTIVEANWHLSVTPYEACKPGFLSGFGVQSYVFLGDVSVDMVVAAHVIDTRLM